MFIFLIICNKSEIDYHHTLYYIRTNICGRKIYGKKHKKKNLYEYGPKCYNIWIGRSGVKQKLRKKLLATKMDFLRRYGRKTRMDKIPNTWESIKI